MYTSQVKNSRYKLIWGISIVPKQNSTYENVTCLFEINIGIENKIECCPL